LPNEMLELDVSEVLPRDRYWYGSEVAKARALGPEWRRGFARDFVVPVGEDALRRHLQGGSTFTVGDGFVYPFQIHGRRHLPEKMPLDESFGWWLGAYLSEAGLRPTMSIFRTRTRGSFAVRAPLPTPTESGTPNTTTIG